MPFLGHQNHFYQNYFYVTLFSSFRAFIWCVIHAYSPYVKYDPKLGGFGKLGHPKKGGHLRFEFGPPSNIVSHHPKSICANFGACITTCRFFARTIQVQQKQSPVVRGHHISVVTTYLKSWILISLLRYDTYVFLTFHATNNLWHSPAMKRGYLT